MLNFLFVRQSSQISGMKALFDPNKFRYEDLSSITEDKDLSHLDFLIKAISAKLDAVLDCVKLQHKKI